MKFYNNTSLNQEFEKIESIKYYPYVGKHFLDNKKRIVIYAHNIPSKPEEYEKHIIEKSSNVHFANAMEEFAYEQFNYTKTFRSFIKGSLAINENYTKNSNSEIIDKVDGFIEKIAYANYINDLVPSSTKTNVNIPNDLLKQSHYVNKELIKILNPTHIVCWGKNVFNYFLSQPEVKVIVKPWKNFKENVGLQNRKGFEYALIEINEKSIHILKTFHPSMPSFGHYKEGTQKIMNWFYNL